MAEERSELVATKPKAVEPDKDSKPGFWQTMTGKTAKSVKATTAKSRKVNCFMKALPLLLRPQRSQLARRKSSSST